MDRLKSLERSQTIEELCSHFGVSESTLRRDIDVLASEGLVWKIAGGSVTVRSPEPTWHEKEHQHLEAKTAMARYAAKYLVSHGDVVLLDSGTSAGSLAQCLADRSDLTIVVAGLTSLELLSESRSEVIVLGGRLRRPSASFLGPLAVAALEDMTPDVAFIGCDYLSQEDGLNCPEMDSAAFKSLAMKRSRKTWVMVDESKLTGEPREPFWAPMAEGAGVLTVVPTAAEARGRLEVLHAHAHEVRAVHVAADGTVHRHDARAVSS
jgi:DeoR/GlpR family transcriptional regulator of sugar metabolism